MPQAKKYYDIRNTVTGKKYIAISAAEFDEMMGKHVNVSQYLKNGGKYKEWVIKLHEDEEDEEDFSGMSREQLFVEFGRRARKFRNVEWVLSGGKKLVINSKKRKG